MQTFSFVFDLDEQKKDLAGFFFKAMMYFHLQDGYKLQEFETPVSLRRTQQGYNNV